MGKYGETEAQRGWSSNPGCESSEWILAALGMVQEKGEWCRKRGRIGAEGTVQGKGNDVEEGE